MKPTYGLVPRMPDGAGWLLLTHFGPLTRTVADCGRALAAIAGPDPLDPLCLPALGLDYAAAAREPGDLSGLRVAYSDDLGYIRLDREVRERFAEAVAAFARATGATVEEAHPGARLAARRLERDRLRRQHRERGPAARDAASSATTRAR